jgi:hypothetical protein
MPDMFSLAPYTPAVNAKVETRARQYALPIPPRIVRRDVTAAVHTASASRRGPGSRGLQGVRSRGRRGAKMPFVFPRRM